MSSKMALKDVYAKPLASLDDLGGQLAFHLKVLRSVPRSVTRYPREIMRILAEVTLGSGALAVIGGTVGVIIGMTFFTGAQVGLSGYAALNQLGTAAFSGFVSAYFNTREIAPLVAGIALAATVGCGFTAQLGAMRISEEIDALEVMSVPSKAYLVATRVAAALLAIIPLYLFSLYASFAAIALILLLYLFLEKTPYGAMIKAGAMDDFGDSRRGLMHQLPEALKTAEQQAIWGGNSSGWPPSCQALSATAKAAAKPTPTQKNVLMTTSVIFAASSCT